MIARGAPSTSAKTKMHAKAIAQTLLLVQPCVSDNVYLADSLTETMWPRSSGFVAMGAIGTYAALQCP